MDSINEQVKRCNSLASSKNSKKSSQLVETFNEDENGVKPDNVVVFTQKLVSGELTEQLMRFLDSGFWRLE